MCPLSSKGVIPFAVSIALNEPCAEPLHSLPVLPASRIVQRNFTVCVAPLHFLHSVAYQLVEWIELNRILGAEFFVFYSYSLVDKDKQVLDYYSKQGLAEVHPWTLVIEKRLVHYFAQMAALNECITRHQSDTKFIAVFDLDEFIIPRTSSDITWYDMLKKLPDAASYMFRHILLPLNARTNNKVAFSTEPLPRNKSLIFSALKRKSYIYPLEKRSKIIINPRKVYVSCMHYVIKYSHKAVGRKKVVVNDSVGLLHHYRDGALSRAEEGEDEGMVIDRTLLKYQDLVVQRLNKMWRDINKV